MRADAAGLGGDGDSSTPETPSTTSRTARSETEVTKSALERDQDLVEELCANVAEQFHGESVPLDCEPVFGDLVAAHEAQSRHRLLGLTQLQLGDNSYDQDLGLAREQRHSRSKIFKKSRGKSRAAEMALLEEWTYVHIYAGAMPAHDEFQLTEHDEHSGLRQDGDCEKELALVAKAPAIAQRFVSVRRRALPQLQDAAAAERFVNRFVEAVTESFRKPKCRTFTAAFFEAAAARFDMQGSSAPSKRRRYSSSDSESSSSESSDESSSSEPAPKKKKKKQKAEKKRSPSRRGKGVSKSQEPEKSKKGKCCWTWARRLITGKGKKCPGKCGYAHKFKDKKQEESTRKRME